MSIFFVLQNHMLLFSFYSIAANMFFVQTHYVFLFAFFPVFFGLCRTDTVEFKDLVLHIERRHWIELGLHTIHFWLHTIHFCAIKVAHQNLTTTPLISC
jgi:hypothetical protein